VVTKLHFAVEEIYKLEKEKLKKDQQSETKS
jgi:hypothetical protein